LSLPSPFLRLSLLLFLLSIPAADLLLQLLSLLPLQLLLHFAFAFASLVVIP